MRQVASLSLTLILGSLGGCAALSGPVAQRTDPPPDVRIVRVPTTLTHTTGQTSTLILGVQ
jgi:hypothetical protein